MKIQIIIFVVLSVVSAAYAIEHACDKVHFVDRQTWRAPGSMNHSTIELPVHHVFIHHTFMAFCNDTESCSKEMRNIYELHTTPPREWGDIGYNFLIGGDGKVYIGRNWNAEGAHTYGMNFKSVAFSFMGDYTSGLPNKHMMEASKDLIACGIEKGVIAHDYELHGHRDQCCTECPGDAFYAHIKSWPHFKGGPLSTYICNSK